MSPIVGLTQGLVSTTAGVANQTLGLFGNLLGAPQQQRQQRPQAAAPVASGSDTLMQYLILGTAGVAVFQVVKVLTKN